MVRSFRPIREDEASRLVADISAACSAELGEPVNVTARVAALVNDSLMRAMMGDRFERRDEFLESLYELVKIAAAFNIGDLFPSSRLVSAINGTVRKSKAFHRKMYELVDYAIEQRMKRKAEAGAAEETFIDVLLRIQEEDSHRVGAIKPVILDFFAGGSETTSTTITWAMVELMRNPSVMQSAQAEIRRALQADHKTRVTEDDLTSFPYLKLVVKETLRLHPAAPLLIPRECQRPCKVLGYDVPKGTVVLVNAWAIGRDPEHWDEPEVFRPEQFRREGGAGLDFMGSDLRYIPFGAGRRACPGVAFAMAGVELALATLLFDFDWRLPAGMAPSEVDAAEEMGITVYPKRDLLLHPSVVVLPLPLDELLL